jgi:ligand-binding sensor domain-containing protein/signal transduction histidine kinase
MNIFCPSYLIRRRQIFFAFVVLAGFVSFLATFSKAERLPIKTYTVADGLLRDYVYKIKADSRGFLWFCSPGGLSRFDGYAFTNFTTEDGLPHLHINDFLESHDGKIWIATDAGLVRLNPKGLRKSRTNPLFSIYLPANPKAVKILNLVKNKNGSIFAGTADGLYRLTEKNGQFALDVIKLFPALQTKPLEITSIISDRRDALWIGTNNHGLLRLLPDEPEKVEQFTSKHGLPGNSIESLLEDKNGRIWVGMRAGLGAGLILLKTEPHNNQQIVEYIFTTRNGLPDDWILALNQTSDGQMWVATIRGLCKWQGGYSDPGQRQVCRTFTSENNMCDTDIWSLTEDKDGNLWSGTRCGVKKLARSGFVTYTERDGIDTAFINSIFENYAGEIFVSFDQGNNRTVSRFNGEKFDLIKPNFPSRITYFGWGNKQTVHQDRTGDWWFPTADGLYRFAKPSRFENLSKLIPQRVAPTTGKIEIFRLFEDSRGDFWIATTGLRGNGLWHWAKDLNIWHDYSPELNFTGTDRLAWVFAEDPAGNLWITTGGNESEPSLIRYRAGKFKIFTKTNGIPEGLLVDLFVDSRNRLWIASNSEGLLRLDDLTGDQLNFKRYTTSEGLSTPNVLCVTEDEFGRMYICTGRGLDRLNPESGQIENFTTADGLPNSYPQIAYRDRNKTLWFATTDGLARFFPEPNRQRKPPNALITGLRVAGISKSVSVLGESSISNIELGNNERQVTVDFLGLGTNLGEKLKYEYRFSQTAWVEVTERTVNFANLSSGSYRFEVRTQTADRIYSLPAIVEFRIAAPFWQRWWFILLSSGLIALVVYLIYRNRLRQLLELERMRTRIATDLHDDIGANLTRISLLSEVARQKGEKQNSDLLSSIADIARESVSSMNDIVWAISPQHDRLLDLTRRMRQHAEEIFVWRNIDLEFVAPTNDLDLQLKVSVRRDVLLIFKEVVSNTVRHSDSTRVAIDFRCENSILFLSISDNGKGFEPEISVTDGQGLTSTKRRALAIGGKLEIDSKPGRGTVVKLKLPILKANRN